LVVQETRIPQSAIRNPKSEIVMGVRQKTLLITGLTLAGLIVILYVTSRVILLRSFAELEARYVRNNVKRALNAFFDDLLTLKQTAEDNAEWDDTYDFIADGKPDYVKSNYPDETFAIMKINFLFLVDTSGAIVFGRGLDLVSNKEIPIPPNLLAQLSKDSLLVRDALAGKSISGILPLPEGSLLTASNPILTTDSQGPVRGAMIMGRYLDAAQIRHLAEITRLSLSLHSLRGAVKLPGLPPRRNLWWSEDTTIIVHPLSADSVAGYAILKNLHGRPELAARVVMARNIYHQGRVSISYFVFALLLSGLVFGGVSLLLLEKVVISRFARLSAEVSHIGASDDHALRATVSGNDELSQLAGAINKMLDSLQRSQEELRNLSAHLEFLREEERAAMAREIHDELGQVLSTLKMDLGTLENHFPKDQKILFEITQSMSELIYLTIQRVKRISQELRPSVLDHLSFAQAVAWQVDEFIKKAGIPCQLSIHNADNLKLTREVSNALFRVLQEALTNIIRHAEATQVRVELEKTNAHVALKVQDNGKGMTQKEMTDPRSFGLIGMRERVHRLKGNLKIVSNYRQGTAIIASVPFANAEGSTA
jgi:signal transduction histidine kinase